MPIYAYRCDNCGFQQDVLQKMSDPPRVVCPSCDQPALKKQVTAAGFQLKGSGWYVTDFRNPAAKEGAKPAAGDGPGGDAKKEGATTDSKPAADAPVAPTAPAPAADGKAAPAPAKAAPAPTGGD